MRIVKEVVLPRTRSPQYVADQNVRRLLAPKCPPEPLDRPALLGAAVSLLVLAGLLAVVWWGL